MAKDYIILRYAPVIFTTFFPYFLRKSYRYPQKRTKLSVRDTNLTIAIDFGLKNSHMAIFLNGAPHVIPNAEGETSTPSTVAYTRERNLLVGTPAVEQSHCNPENTFFFAKAFLGRMPGDVQKGEIDELSCRLDLAGSKIYYMCPAIGQALSPEEVTALIFEKLAKDASAYLNGDVKRVVLSVPVHFDHAQRTAIKSAAHLANLEVAHLINETTCSSAFLGFQGGFKRNRLVVCDLGQGTLDISIVDIRPNTIEVLFNSHTPDLRGSDLDEVMARYLVDEVEKKKGIKFSEGHVRRLIKTAEKVKKKLLSSFVTSVGVSLVWVSPKGILEPVAVNVKRKTFEYRCRKLFKTYVAALTRAIRPLSSVGGFSSVGRVALTGGTAKIPALRKLVERTTKTPLVPMTDTVHSVALGAAIKAHTTMKRGGKGISFLELMPVPLGVEVQGGFMEVLVQESYYVPVVVDAVFSAFPIHNRVDFRLLQGRERLAANNKTLGYFSLVDAREDSTGRVTIGVELSIDSGGLISTIMVEETGTENREYMEVASAPEPGEDVMHELVYGRRGYDTFKVISVVGMKDQFLRIFGDVMEKNSQGGWDNETARACNDLLSETRDLLKRRKWNDALKNFPELEGLLKGKSPDRTVLGDGYLAEASEEISPYLDRRCYNLLRRQGISTLGDLVSQSEASLMKTEGFGPKALKETTRWLRTEHSIVLPES